VAATHIRLQTANSVLSWFNAKYDIGGMGFHIVLGDFSISLVITARHSMYSSSRPTADTQGRYTLMSSNCLICEMIYRVFRLINFVIPARFSFT